MRQYLVASLAFGLLGLGCFLSVSHAQTPLSAPAAQLGLPQAAARLELPRASTENNFSIAPRLTVRAAPPDPLVGEYSASAPRENRPAVTFGPVSDIRTDSSIRPAPVDLIETPEERYNWGMPDRGDSNRSRGSNSRKFGDRMKGWWEDSVGGVGNSTLESDHCFDNFTSPLSNPFLAEDPRALTELRAMYFFQTVPSSQIYFDGGNIQMFALQGRIAFSERFSLVLHKLGVTWMNPGDNARVSGATGITELWLSPKYTFYRDEQTGTIAAGGLMFQIPIGPAEVFQDTGSLSLVPYISFAQKFGRTSWGEFTIMNTFGYSFSTTSQRSDYLYNSLHLDLDVGGMGRFYPMVELNWFCYTTNGEASNLGFEGRDWANIGSAVDGRNFLSIAPGFRYKFSEKWQAGVYTEFPLLGTRDLMNFRFGLDLIWRF